MTKEEFYANVIDLSDTNQVNESIIEMQEQQYKKLIKKYEKAVNDYEQEHYKVVKAIELTKIRIESCNACLSNDETSIISKHSLLRLEKQSYKELLEILEDKENDIELDVLKALNTDLDDDVEMG